jgi:hypothetical protein
MTAGSLVSLRASTADTTSDARVAPIRVAQAKKFVPQSAIVPCRSQGTCTGEIPVNERAHGFGARHHRNRFPQITAHVEDGGRNWSFVGHIELL